MIYKDNITTEYGEKTLFLGSSPIAYQPIPTAEDYKIGNFKRWFSKRVNQDIVTEIDPRKKSEIDKGLYATVSLTWKISGPMNPIIVNGIKEISGVEQDNKTEIERVRREDGIDLRRTLKNPLELWRGY